MNGNNAKIVKRWRRRVTPTQVTAQGFTVERITGSLKWKKKGKLTYQDVPSNVIAPNFTSSQVLEGYQYYLLVGWGATAQIATANRPFCTVDSYVYFKDP